MCAGDGAKNDFLDFSVDNSQMALSMTENRSGIDCTKFQPDRSKIGEVIWILQGWALSV